MERQTDKIYRRPTQKSNTPQKKKNEKNRLRNHYYNMHVTENEKKLIENRIDLLGMPKSVFFRQSLLYQALYVKWNLRSADLIKKRLDELEGAIQAGETLVEMDPLLVDSIRCILEILDKLYGRKRNYK